MTPAPLPDRARGAQRHGRSGSADRCSGGSERPRFGYSGSRISRKIGCARRARMKYSGSFGGQADRRALQGFVLGQFRRRPVGQRSGEQTGAVGVQLLVVELGIDSIAEEEGDAAALANVFLQVLQAPYRSARGRCTGKCSDTCAGRAFPGRRAAGNQLVAGGNIAALLEKDAHEDRCRRLPCGRWPGRHRSPGSAPCRGTSTAA